jgi:hypothetical protein
MKNSLSFLLDPTETNTTSTDVLVVKALLFYEGDHEDMSGTSLKVTEKVLKKIVAATNKWIAAGRRIKLFVNDQDHAISQSGTIGFVSPGAKLTLEKIEEVPEGSPQDLVGLWGIFTEITLAGDETVRQYRDGRLREISVGITKDYEIYHISAVSIPALAGASLYGLSLRDSMEDKATRQIMDEAWRLYDIFASTLWDISNTSAESIKETGKTPEELRRAAYDDYVKLLGQLFLGDSPEMDQKDLEAKVALLEAENAKLKLDKELFSRAQKLDTAWAALKATGLTLVNSGKLSVNLYNKFSAVSLGSEVTEESLAAFSTHVQNVKFLLESLSESDGILQGMLPQNPQNPDGKAAEDALKFAQKVLDFGSMPRLI